MAKKLISKKSPEPDTLIDFDACIFDSCVPKIIPWQGDFADYALASVAAVGEYSLDDVSEGISQEMIRKTSEIMTKLINDYHPQEGSWIRSALGSVLTNGFVSGNAKQDFDNQAKWNSRIDRSLYVWRLPALKNETCVFTGLPAQKIIGREDFGMASKMDEGPIPVNGAFLTAVYAMYFCGYYTMSDILVPFTNSFEINYELAKRQWVNNQQFIHLLDVEDTFKNSKKGNKETVDTIWNIVETAAPNSKTGLNLHYITLGSQNTYIKPARRAFYAQESANVWNSFYFPENVISWTKQQEIQNPVSHQILRDLLSYRWYDFLYNLSSPALRYRAINDWKRLFVRPDDFMLSPKDYFKNRREEKPENKQDQESIHSKYKNELLIKTKESLPKQWEAIMSYMHPLLTSDNMQPLDPTVKEDIELLGGLIASCVENETSKSKRQWWFDFVNKSSYPGQLLNLLNSKAAVRGILDNNHLEAYMRLFPATLDNNDARERVSLIAMYSACVLRTNHWVGFGEDLKEENQTTNNGEINND